MKDNNVMEIELGQIMPNPNQPRKTFDEAELNNLRQTIEHGGQIEPLWVVPITAPDVPNNIRPTNGHRYLLIDGERRLRAMEALGRNTVKVQEVDTSYTGAYHKGIIKHKTTARHDDVEKARGIVEDLNNHLSQIEGFEKLANGAVTLINYLDSKKRGKAWDLGIPHQLVREMEKTAERVCDSAGYTVNTLRTQQLPLLGLKPDLLEEVGKIVEGTSTGKKKGKKRGWRIPASTLSKLNSITDNGLRAGALAYVKRHKLTRDRAQTLAGTVNTAEPDVTDDLLNDKISLEEAKRSVERSATGEEMDEVAREIDILEDEVAWLDGEFRELEPVPELEEQVGSEPQKLPVETMNEPEPVRCDRIRDDLRTFNPYSMKNMPKEVIDRTVTSLREIQVMVSALLEQLEPVQ